MRNKNARKCQFCEHWSADSSVCYERGECTSAHCSCDEWIINRDMAIHLVRDSEIIDVGFNKKTIKELKGELLSARQRNYQ